MGELGDGPLEWLLWQTLVGRVAARRAAADALPGQGRARGEAAHVVDPARRRVRGGAGRATCSACSPTTPYGPGSPRRSTGCTPGSSPTASGSACCSWCCRASPTSTRAASRCRLRLVDPDNRVPPDPVELAAVLDRALAGGPRPDRRPGGGQGPADRAGPAASDATTRSGSAPRGRTTPSTRTGPADEHVVACARAGRGRRRGDAPGAAAGGRRRLARDRRRRPGRQLDRRAHRSRAPQRRPSACRPPTCWVPGRSPCWCATAADVLLQVWAPRALTGVDVVAADPTEGGRPLRAALPRGPGAPRLVRRRGRVAAPRRALPPEPGRRRPAARPAGPPPAGRRARSGAGLGPGHLRVARRRLGRPCPARRGRRLRAARRDVHREPGRSTPRSRTSGTCATSASATSS